MSSNTEIIQLAIAYALMGAAIVTVIIMCLSIIGKMKLFRLLLIQLCIIAIGFYLGLLKFNPIEVKNNIAARGADQFSFDSRRFRHKDPDRDDALAKDVDIAKILRFWKPDGEKVDSKNEQIIGDWLKRQGLSSTSITAFTQSKVYAPLRSRMVIELNLK